MVWFFWQVSLYYYYKLLRSEMNGDIMEKNIYRNNVVDLVPEREIIKPCSKCINHNVHKDFRNIFRI